MVAIYIYIYICVNKQTKTNKMKEIKLTSEIRKEIKQSIKEFDLMIKKEMTFPVHLRKNDKVVIYTNKIIELQKALINNVI